MMPVSVTTRNCLEFGMKKPVLKIAARSLSAIRRSWANWRQTLGLGAPKAFERSRYGVDLSANWNDRTFQYCLYATYGHELSDILTARRTPFVFLDIGANQGLFSLIAAKNSACMAAIAFEPVSKTFELLKANIEANHFGARITPVLAGISEKTGRSEMSVCHTHSGGASLRNGGIADGFEAEAVELICHDELDSMLSSGHPIIVKIDVEGHEEIVIRELMRSVHRDRFEAIFYEIDERWVNPRAILGLLEQHGFDRFTKFGIGRHYDTLAQRPTILLRPDHPHEMPQGPTEEQPHPR